MDRMRQRRMRLADERSSPDIDEAPLRSAHRPGSGAAAPWDKPWDPQSPKPGTSSGRPPLRPTEPQAKQSDRHKIMQRRAARHSRDDEEFRDTARDRPKREGRRDTDESPPPRPPPSRPTPCRRDTSESPPPRPAPSSGSCSERRGGDFPQARASPRVRGPSAAMEARAQEADDVDLPPGVQTADFGSLQAMISKQIKQSEVDSEHLERNCSTPVVDPLEERKLREARAKKREEEEENRKQEKERARMQRQREYEQRKKQMEEELNREDEERRLAEEAKREEDARRRRDNNAAVRIQKIHRGRSCRRSLGEPRSGSDTAAPA